MVGFDVVLAYEYDGNSDKLIKTATGDKKMKIWRYMVQQPYFVGALYVYDIAFARTQ